MSNVSGVQASIWSLQVASRIAIETEDLNLSIMVCLKFGWTIVFLSMPTVRSWWSQWGVMAVHHCYSWWRWQSRMLWVMLMRLWLESLSSCFFCVVLFNLQLIDMSICVMELLSLEGRFYAVTPLWRLCFIQ